MKQIKLRECHAEHSYYYLMLRPAMERIIKRKGLSGVSSEIIDAFCSGESGDHIIGGTDDYNYILDRFRHFITGIAWALTHHSASNHDGN